MLTEWNVIMKTDGANLFTLGLFAENFNSAKSKAKKLSNGCKVVSVNEETRRWAFTQLKGEHALPVLSNA